MNAAAILLAAGRGERLGSEVPKAFAELDGRPLLAYALDAARGVGSVGRIVVTVPPGWEAHAGGMAGEAEVVTGGDTRTASVAAALAWLARGDEPDAVICHDAARPLAPARAFEAVLEALRDAEGAVPVVPLTDTVKRVDAGRVVETVPRGDLVAVQTPQAFRWEAIRRAHEQAARDGVEATDDAALLERLGLGVAIVEGDPRNIKITRPDDLELAAALLRKARA